MILTLVAIICALIAVSSCRTAFPDTTNDNFKNQCLRSHNEYRALHSTPALVIDQSVINYAKSRCTTVSQYNGLEEGHKGLKSGVYGENMFWGSGRWTGKDAVKMWYDEYKYYDYNKPGFSGKTGHFTQVVWKATTKLGCAQCSNGKEIYIVCNYQTAGNYEGQFPKNVLPKK